MITDESSGNHSSLMTVQRHYEPKSFAVMSKTSGLSTGQVGKKMDGRGRWAMGVSRLQEEIPQCS